MSTARCRLYWWSGGFGVDFLYRLRIGDLHYLATDNDIHSFCILMVNFDPNFHPFP